jgi:hypothetical protein
VSPDERVHETGIAGWDTAWAKHALRSGDSRFAEVARVWLLLTDPSAPPADRARLGELFAQLRGALADATNGEAEMAFFPDARAAAALITPDLVDRDELRSSRGLQVVIGDPSLIDPLAQELLFRADALHEQAVAYLNRAERTIMLRRVYSIVVAVLGALQPPHAEQDRSHPEVARLRAIARELDSTQAWFANALERDAQIHYSIGMFAGTTLIGSVLGTAIVPLTGTGEELAVSSLAGALGAGVSVLSRVTSGELGLRTQVRPAMLRAFGAVRPLVGSVLGVFIWLVITSLPGSWLHWVDVRSLAFLGVLGFVAGFNERFARDALSAPAAGLGDDPAAHVARAAGRAVRWGWRSAPKTEFAEFLRATVTSSINDVVGGPTLVNWSGYVRTELDGTGDSDGDEEGGPVAPFRPGAQGTLRVVFAARPTGLPSERPIDIVDGEDADAAPFRLIPTSDRLHFEARSTDASVPNLGGCTVTLRFTAPEEPGRYSLWVQIRQRNRTVQVLPATVVIEKPAVPHGP